MATEGDPVKGGDSLSKALGAIVDKLSTASSVQVGFLEGSQEPDGASSPMVAAIQEFGAPRKGIPPRPFFRNMIKAHSSEWPEKMQALLKANGYDAAKSLDQLGAEVASDLQQSIIDMIAPPLSPITVMLRGMRTQKRYKDLPFGKLIAAAAERVAAGKTNYGASTKPLVDSGALYENVDHIVK